MAAAHRYFPFREPPLRGPARGGGCPWGLPQGRVHEEGQSRKNQGPGGTGGHTLSQSLGGVRRRLQSWRHREGSGSSLTHVSTWQKQGDQKYFFPTWFPALSLFWTYSVLQTLGDAESAGCGPGLFWRSNTGAHLWESQKEVGSAHGSCLEEQRSCSLCSVLGTCSGDRTCVEDLTSFHCNAFPCPGREGLHLCPGQNGPLTLT